MYNGTGFDKFNPPVQPFLDDKTVPNPEKLHCNKRVTESEIP